MPISRFAVYMLPVGFGWVLVVVIVNVVVPGGKQSQLQVLRLRLKFDNKNKKIISFRGYLINPAQIELSRV